MFPGNNKKTHGTYLSMEITRFNSVADLHIYGEVSTLQIVIPACVRCRCNITLNHLNHNTRITIT